MKTLGVTFDSNVWEEISVPEKLAKHKDCQALEVIRGAIETGRIKPYISDVIFTLEAVQHDVRDFYQSVMMRKTMSDGYNDPANSGLLTYKVTVGADLSHHPGPNEYVSRALSNAIPMGFKLLSVPRVGMPRVPREDLYKPYANEAELSERLQRTVNAMNKIEAKGFGAAGVHQLGEEVRKKRPELHNLSPFFAFSYADWITNKTLTKLTAEWADGDALAAHYGCNHDVFCTNDIGGKGGIKSVLHSSHRSWLATEFGIKIMTPSQLAEEINAQSPH